MVRLLMLVTVAASMFSLPAAAQARTQPRSGRAQPGRITALSLVVRHRH